MIENHDYGIASCLYPSGILNDLIESGEVEVEGSSLSDEENKNKLVRFGIADCRKLDEKAYNGAKSYFMYKAKMFEMKDFDCKVTDGYAMKMNIEAEYGEKGDGDYSEYVSGWKELTVVMLENEGWYIIFSEENELIDSASDAVN
jgi:hypothetical protein